DGHIILPGQDRDALAEDRRAGLLALLEDPAPACGERGGNHQCNTEAFRSLHSGSYRAWLWSAALTSTPNEAASCAARLRNELGTVVSLAMAANSWPASVRLPCLASASAVISPALPNQGSPAFASGSRREITSCGWSLSNSSAVWRMRAASRYGSGRPVSPPRV